MEYFYQEEVNNNTHGDFAFDENQLEASEYITNEMKAITFDAHVEEEKETGETSDTVPKVRFDR